MKEILVISIVALTLIAVVLTGCSKSGDGTVTALANTSADERYPVWSPDGSKIAFDTGKVNDGKLSRDIYVIDVPAS